LRTGINLTDNFESISVLLGLEVFAIRGWPCLGINEPIDFLFVERNQFPTKDPDTIVHYLPFILQMGIETTQID